MHAYLGVVPGLQGFSIIRLACVLGLRYQVIQTVIDDFQVGVELALAGNQVLGKGQVPVGDVERGSVLCFFKHTIHCLRLQSTCVSAGLSLSVCSQATPQMHACLLDPHIGALGKL